MSFSVVVVFFEIGTERNNTEKTNRKTTATIFVTSHMQHHLKIDTKPPQPIIVQAAAAAEMREQTDDEVVLRKRSAEEALRNAQCAREALLVSSALGRHLRSRIGSDFTPRLERLAPVVSTDSETLNVIILVSGSFNPIHRSHVRAAQVAAAEVDRQLRSGEASVHKHIAFKQALSKAGHDFQQLNAPATAQPQQKAQIIAVALIPSSDGHVRGKLGAKEAMPCVLRCELCDLAALDEIEEHTAHVAELCQTAASSTSNVLLSPLVPTIDDRVKPFYPLIVLPYNQASGEFCGQLLDRELAQAYPGKRFLSLCMYGSDCAARWGCRQMVCVERHDAEKSGAKVRSVVESGKAGENFIFVPTVPGSPSEVPAASSTAIRNALNDPSAAASQETLRQMLHPSVVNKMIEVSSRPPARRGG